MVNKYGLDVRYFKDKLAMIKQNANSMSPTEMFNDLSRLALVAGEQANLRVKIDVRYLNANEDAPSQTKICHD